MFNDSWSSLAAWPDDRAAIWRCVRGANYVIARGWQRTMQARLARRETMVDDLSDFSNMFLTALYVHVELWAYVFHTNSNC